MTTTTKPKICPVWANFQPSRTSYTWVPTISSSAAMSRRCRSSAITRILSAASGTPRLYPTNKSGGGSIPEYCWCWTWKTVLGSVLAGAWCLSRRFDFVNSYLAFILSHRSPQCFTDTNPRVFTQSKFFTQLCVLRLHFFTRSDFGFFRKRAGEIPHRTKTHPKRLRFSHYFLQKQKQLRPF